MIKHLIFLLLISGSLLSQDYIQIIKPDINIRMSPTTASPIVGTAFEGEEYILNGEKGKWYSVLLPSGETRWIYKRLAEKTNIKDSLPKSVNILNVQEELKIVSEKAHEDSNEEVIKDLNKIEINNILFDRYSLIVLQTHNISPIFYQEIINYVEPVIIKKREILAEHMVSVSHIDYDLFKIDFFNFYIETRRCFKLGSALDAKVFMYYEGEDFIQKLCFEDGYGKGFENCYNIKNIYSAVLEDPHLVALTKDGKIKKTNLILKEALLDLPDSNY